MANYRRWRVGAVDVALAILILVLLSGTVTAMYCEGRP